MDTKGHHTEEPYSLRHQYRMTKTHTPRCTRKTKKDSPRFTSCIQNRNFTSLISFSTLLATFTILASSLSALTFSASISDSSLPELAFGPAISASSLWASDVLPRRLPTSLPPAIGSISMADAEDATANEDVIVNEQLAPFVSSVFLYFISFLKNPHEVGSSLSFNGHLKNTFPLFSPFLQTSSITSSLWQMGHRIRGNLVLCPTANSKLHALLIVDKVAAGGDSRRRGDRCVAGGDAAGGEGRDAAALASRLRSASAALRG
uniref:Uncharacterized protein n=1 Tax=Arundo donax TaxID=35708 RepID=A0A0A9ACC9_ARUDO